MIIGIMLFGFQHSAWADPPFQKRGMIKLTVFYPNGPEKTFNWDYYLAKHMALVKKVFGKNLKAVAIDKGLSGKGAKAEPTYLAICHLYFDSIADYEEPMKENGSKFAEDFPKYTNVKPEVQISEVIE